MLVDFKGHMETCCIDSGSDISLIDKQMLKEVPAFKKVKIHPNDITNVYSASGEYLRFAGYFYTQGVIGGVKVTLKFYIPYKSKCRIILGTDFLHKYQVVINYQTNTLELAKQTQVKLSEGIVLEPGKEKEVTGVMEDTEGIPEMYVLFKLRPHYKGVTLGPARTISMSVDNKVPFIIQNLSHKVAIIPAGELVGSVTPIRADALIQHKGVCCIQRGHEKCPSVPREQVLQQLDSDSNDEIESDEHVLITGSERHDVTRESTMSSLDGIVELSGYEADESSAADTTGPSLSAEGSPQQTQVRRSKRVSAKRDPTAEGKSSSDCTEVSMHVHPPVSFSKYEEEDSEERSGILMPEADAHSYLVPLRSSTPNRMEDPPPTPNMSSSDDEEIYPSDDEPLPVPPNSPFSDNETKRVMFISVPEQVHTQINESMEQSRHIVPSISCKDDNSEVNLTYPIKIEETNNYGLIQYPTDQLLLEHEKYPEVTDCMIQRQNKLIKEMVSKIEHPELKQRQKTDLQRTLQKYHKAISFEGELGAAKGVAVRLKFKPHSPIFAQQRWATSPKEQEFIQHHLDKLENAGVIARMNSLYSHPTFLVRKPAAKLKNLKTLTPADFRMVSDVRLLNAVAIVNPSPIPMLNELFAKIGSHGNGNEYVMSTLDLRSGFYQVLVTPDSWAYTGFKRNGKSYAYRRLMQGLSVSPYVFQSLLTYILSDLKDINVVNFLDDCLLVSNSIEQHIEDLGKLLERFEQVNMKFSLDKMYLCRSSIDFMGFRLQNGAIYPQQQKLEIIQELKPPTTLRQTRRILGILNYYRRFVKNFAKLAAPITALTKKGREIKWTDDCAKALSSLKTEMKYSPGLAIPDFSKEWLVYCDASDIALGSVLLQAPKDNLKNICPISFDSRLLLPSEQNYTILDKEILAIAFALEQYQMYLQFCHVNIFSDSSAAVFMLKSNNHKGKSNKMLRLLCFIKSFTFTINYIKSADNISDILTRDLLSKTVPTMETYEEIFSSDQDKYVLYHKIYSDDCMADEELNWPEYELNHKTTSDLKEYFTSKWHPLYSIPEDGMNDDTICGRDQQFIREPSFRVRAVTRQQAKRQHIEALRHKLSMDKEEDPFETEEGESDPSAEGGVQGPSGLQIAFPYEDFNPFEDVDLENGEDRKGCDSTNHKMIKRPNVVFPALSPKIIEELQESETKFDTESWRDKQLNDPCFGPIIRYLEGDDLLDLTYKKAKRVILDSHQYFIHDGILYRSCKPKYEASAELQYQLCIPKELQETFAKLAHDDPGISSHQNALQSYLTFKNKYYFPGMLSMIERFASSCHECQSKKNYGSRPLYPIDLNAQRPYDPNIHSVVIDLVGPLTPSVPLIDQLQMKRIKEQEKKGLSCASFTPRRFKYLLTVIQEATRFVVAIPLQNVTAPTVALSFLEHYVLKYGPPHSVHSDRGTVFLSSLFKYVCKALQMAKSVSASFNPTSSAKVERCHRTIINRLSACVGSDSHNWTTYLPYVLYSYNSSIHSSTGFSPYHLLYGKQPQFGFERNLPVIPEPVLTSFPITVKHFFEGMQRLKYIASKNMEKYTQKYIQRHNAKSNPIDFDVSDLVYLRCATRSLPPPGDSDTTDNPQPKERMSFKLAPKWFGPLKVIQKLPSNIYRLMDIYTSRVLPSYYHGRLLKIAYLRPQYPLEMGYELPESVKIPEDESNLNPAIILHKNAQQRNTTKSSNIPSDQDTQHGDVSDLRGLLTPPPSPPDVD